MVDGRGVCGSPLCPSDIPPKFHSAEFRGDSAIGISLQLGEYSSFSIHNSSLLFWREKVLSELRLRVVRFRNDEVMRELSAVVGKIREFIIHPSAFILALLAGEGDVRAKPSYLRDLFRSLSRTAFPGFDGSKRTKTFLPTEYFWIAISPMR